MKGFCAFLCIYVVVFSFNSEAKKNRGGRIKENTDYEEIIIPPADHKHGIGQIEIKTTGKTGTISFSSSAESTISFEPEPELEVDKLKIEEVKMKFKNRISEMILFDPKLGCQIENTGMEIKYHSPVVAVIKSKKNKKGKKKNVMHSDFYANYILKCEEKIEKSVIKFDFSYFPKLKNISILFESDSAKDEFIYSGQVLEHTLK